MQRILPVDAGYLFGETPEMPNHTMGVLRLARTRDGLFERLERVLAERIHLLPPMRRRVVSDPLGLGDVYWIEDPGFSLREHLVHARLQAPGGERELARYAGSFAARLLDRSRPLWEMHLLEGLSGGGSALLLKMHHAAMDGARLVALMRTLFDTTARGRRVPPPAQPWRPDAEPSALWLAAGTARTLAEKPLRAARSLAEIGSALLQGPRAEASAPQAGTDREPAAARPFEAPPTRFNGALSAARAVAMADVAFADVKAVADAFGATVNDVVLAAASGALGAWLEAHGGLPDRPLVASVPVALREEGAKDGEAGNRVTVMLVHLPVQAADPVRRLQAISAETTRAKARLGGQQGSKGNVVRQAAELLQNVSVPWVWPHIMGAFASGAIASRLPPLWNVVVSNVPGPRETLYCAGARVERIYPFGPVQLGNGLNITVMSSGDRLCLGALACKRMVPEVERIAQQFEREITALHRRAARRRR